MNSYRKTFLYIVKYFAIYTDNLVTFMVSTEETIYL